MVTTIETETKVLSTSQQVIIRKTVIFVSVRLHYQTPRNFLDMVISL